VGATGRRRLALPSRALGSGGITDSDSGEVFDGSSKLLYGIRHARVGIDQQNPVVQTCRSIRTTRFGKILISFRHAIQRGFILPECDKCLREEMPKVVERVPGNPHFDVASGGPTERRKLLEA